jgi:glycosyltransferase involved in cell wall biosynthesis
MTKVVHLITSLDSGGAEMMLVKLLAGIDRARFDSCVVSMTSGGSLLAAVESMRVPVRTLGLRRGVPSFGGFVQFLRLLRRERPHILQTWLYHADLMGLAASRLCRVPRLVWNLRSSHVDMSCYSWLSGAVLRALARLSRWPDVVVVNSHAGKASHTSLGYHPRRWAVIPNGFDVKRYRPDRDARVSVRRELRCDSDAPLIGLIARYDPMKDHETFLRAAALLLRQERRARFVLVGRDVDDHNRVLVEAIAALGLGSAVSLLGDRTDVPRIMAALDLFSLSSAFGEGSPNVVGEAMACGVPCVVTDVGDAARMVGETGSVVPPRSPAGLADAWSALLARGADERARLGVAARRRIEAGFALSEIVAQYENLYGELAAGCAG